jgi:hypothetical protein
MKLKCTRAVFSPSVAVVLQTQTTHHPQEDLSHETKDLTELKFVLQTVATICENSMDMELEYVDVVERYQTLVRYKVRTMRGHVCVCVCTSLCGCGCLQSHTWAVQQPSTRIQATRP